MHSCFRCWTVLILGIASAATLATAQERKDRPPERAAGEPGRPATPQDWEKLSGPGEHHKRLDVLVGKWNQAIRTPTPEGKWDETKGVAEYHWIMGGRFLMEEVKCDFAGTKLEWMGIYGYDTPRKKYTAVWVDNFATGTEFAECEAEPSGKVFAFAGEQTDPQTGGKAKFRWVIKVESKDKVQIEMFEPGADGKETKVMEITQTRAGTTSAPTPR